ncbi:hypothetical protein CJ195_26865 [Bacillus sp. UMB0899]|nr:hypothetical protein CJ195_26865 [Bacillus sp. UMB0899]
MKMNEAVEMLTKAGVSENIRTLTIRKWIKEGKITSDDTNGYSLDHQTTELLQSSLREEKKEIIKQFQSKLKVQDEYIEGIKALHENSLKQREQLHQEISLLKKEKNDLQKEMNSLLTENIRLRNDLIKHKENSIHTNSTKAHEQKRETAPLQIRFPLQDYRDKLGLSKLSGKKEVMTAYKELLKISHPDHGGQLKSFQYIKADFDQFKKEFKHK